MAKALSVKKLSMADVKFENIREDKLINPSQEQA